MARPNFDDFDPDFASAAEWAAMYRHYGLQIIPCCSPTEVKPGTSWKRPLLSTWRTLQEELVPDATFRRWYDPVTGDYRARRNMGIITGACSGRAFILDLDLHKNPAAAVWWRGVLQVHNNGSEPETPRQRTGGGGLQLLFRAPAHWTAPTNRTERGVDIRGQGGFAVMPSSLHDSGEAYAWLPGMAPWEIEILEAPEWLCGEIVKLVGATNINSSPGNINSPDSNINSPAPDHGQADRKTGDFDPFGNRVDGREEHMRDMVWRCVVKLRRASPIPPTGEEHQRIIDAEYEVYERTVQVQSPFPLESKRAGLEREGRGASAFLAKWQYAMRQWYEDVAIAAAQPDPSPEAVDPAAEFAAATATAQQTGKLFEYLTVEQILAMADPKWLIDKLMIEHSLGIIYGPPGSLKTFISLDVALSLATKQPSWWGYGIHHTGTVVYISSEGVANLKFRMQAWAQHRGVDIANAPFRLIRQSINFMKAEDIGILLETVQAIVDEAGPVAAVFVDTVSRVLPGAKENQQEDMSLFVAACDQVRNRFMTTVIGLHHTNYAGGMRGSTVIPGAGDFLIEVSRDAGEMQGFIRAKKIKDGEDGWDRPFEATLVELGDIGGHSSLVVDGVEKQANDGTGLPEKNVLRQILAAIDEQWSKGKPWCHSKVSTRCAETNISRRWEIDRKVAARILEYWNANGVIEEEEADAKRHIKGYKKLLEI